MPQGKIILMIFVAVQSIFSVFFSVASVSLQTALWLDLEYKQVAAAATMRVNKHFRLELLNLPLAADEMVKNSSFITISDHGS